MSGTSSALPDDVVVGFIVDGNVVVHGVALICSISGEYSAVEDAHQRLGLGWDGNGALEQGSGSDATVVHLLVGISSLDHSTTFERDTSKQALGLAVSKDTSDTFERGGTSSFSVAPDGTSGNRDVASKSDTASLSKGADSGSVIEDEDEIGEFETNLTTKATTDGTDCRGSGPEGDVSRYLGQSEEEQYYQEPSARRATMTPEPKRPLPRKPALKTVMMARPLAFARIWGGMILSGPKDCLGSIKDARILPVFLHSPRKY